MKKQTVQPQMKDAFFLPHRQIGRFILMPSELKGVFRKGVQTMFHVF
ncbi:MAG: hypothetical protein ACD_17C00443G0001 [uncultured bacterium]|nr:MAG: hypothetical protein ACD_17C00443G0001 [uncultured bacterium]